ECGQLYFYEFYETIDWEHGEDPQYSTYVPVETAAEIEALKATDHFDLRQFSPRLQHDFPKDAKVPTVYWVRRAFNACRTQETGLDHEPRHQSTDRARRVRRDRCHRRGLRLLQRRSCRTSPGARRQLERDLVPPLGLRSDQLHGKRCLRGVRGARL